MSAVGAHDAAPTLLCDLLDDVAHVAVEHAGLAGGDCGVQTFASGVDKRDGLRVAPSGIADQISLELDLWMMLSVKRVTSSGVVTKPKPKSLLMDSRKIPSLLM